MGVGESFAFLASSSYIRDLATLVVAYGISINLVEVTWKSKLKAQVGARRGEGILPLLVSEPLPIPTRRSSPTPTTTRPSWVTSLPPPVPSPSC